MHLVALFAAVGVALPACVVGVTVDSLPIAASLKLEPGVTLVDRDRARFGALFRRGKAHEEGRAVSVAVKNTAVHYTLSVGVGSPPTYYDLLLDSGSAYTWLGAGKKYVKTKTSQKQPQSFYVAYGSGSAVGDNYKDLVTLSPSLSISNKSIGVASSTNNIGESFDGILGLGPAALSQGVLDPNNGKPVPTVMDALEGCTVQRCPIAGVEDAYRRRRGGHVPGTVPTGTALVAQKKIGSNVFGVSFMPTTSRDVVNGELTFGGTNSAKYTGKLNWVGVTKQSPWNNYWGYEQTIKYGNQTLQASSAGVVDTGTTLIYITPKAFKTFADSLPGSKIDSATKLLEIPKESVGKMKSLFFVINGVSHEFTPNAQLWPRKLNTELGGKADSYYSVISPLSDYEADTGSNFINGYVFLERFYTAYDGSKSSIGFATTSSTYSNVN